MRPLLALAAVLLLAAPAAARTTPLPKVAFAGWTVYDGGAAKKLRPGGTLRSCRAPTELLARGRARRAVKRQKYLETWYRNGHRTDAFSIAWFRAGAFPDSWSLTDAHGFRNGTWTLKLTRRGKLIGRESLKLACP